MFRFFVILGIVVYVIYKIGSLFFRAGAASQQFRNPAQPRRATNGNGSINIDHDPREKKRKGDSQDGEYIDYEEVK